jgi:hypothetical protein
LPSGSKSYAAHSAAAPAQRSAAQQKAKAPVIERRYDPSTDACTRAVQLLLESKTTAERLPSPDGQSHVKESNGYAATPKHIK